MKPQLLEYLVRACTREVLKQLNEGSETVAQAHGITPVNDKEFYSDKHGTWCNKCGSGVTTVKTKKGVAYKCNSNNGKSNCANSRVDEEETKGAPAPPADGQGTADQPAIPKTEDPKPAATPSQPETPKEKLKPIKGINVVNPQNKAEVKPLNLQSNADDATIERTLYSRASAMAGPNVKVALATTRAVKSALKNPAAPLFLYIGQYDPQSEELYLLADASIQVARDSSIGADAFASPHTYQSSDLTDPVNSADDDQMAAAITQRFQGYKDRSQAEPEIEFGDNSIDEQVRQLIKKMVNEALDPK